MKKYKFLLILLLFLLLAAAAAFTILDLLIRPALLTICRARVNTQTSDALQNAMLYLLGDDISGQDFTEYVQNAQGEIIGVRANTMKMNVLASETANYVQEELNNVNKASIDIALGTLMGSRLLAGKGPKLKVSISSIGNVNTEFVSEFSQAGINQTWHKVSLLLTASIQIISPLGSETITIANTMPVSETIIVGRVPNTYISDIGNKLNLLPEE